jgi:hypothetical protein
LHAAPTTEDRSHYRKNIVSKIDNIPLEARRRGGKRGGGYNKGRGRAIAFLRGLIGHHGEECVIWPMARDASNGYCHMGWNGKRYWAHRLMCELAHGPAPSDKHEAAHSCGKGHEGCVNPRHLEWKTRAENQADRYVHQRKPHRGRRRILTEEQVAEIRAAAGITKTKDLAARYGVSTGNIRQILTGQTWVSPDFRMFTEDEVRAIRAETGKRLPREIAPAYSVSADTIRRIQQRKSYAHVPDEAAA